MHIFSCSACLLRQWSPRQKYMGSKWLEKFLEKNPCCKIVIDKVLMEFSALHVFSCRYILEEKIQHGFKISRNNHEKNPCHKIWIDGLLGEIMSLKGKSPYFFCKIVWHIYKIKWSRSGTLGVFLPWNNFGNSNILSPHEK